MATVQMALPLETRQEQVIPMSYEEYLTAFEDPIQAEWVNGVAIVFMPPTTRHQRIVWFLSVLVGLFVKRRRLGEFFMAPLEMKLAAQGSSREPDLLFVSNEHLDRVTEKRIEGPADLVVEVISPESAGRDRAEKFDEYQQAGVREYWIIDPRPGLERADFWVLDAQGKYRPVPLDSAGIYRSTILPNFWLDTNWLWQEELPDPVELLAQIMGPEP
ncbi:MAG TPA: Uma2 family endonuclease [Caldilineaceae bacterium]|nr:Uma2 family endonuclease [Caldilineaceae bacterium]